MTEAKYESEIISKKDTKNRTHSERIYMKIDRVIAEPHCISITFSLTLTFLSKYIFMVKFLAWLHRGEQPT